MSSIHRFSLILAALSTFVAVASAQSSLTCSAYTLNQPNLRQEGVTEAAADIIIACAGPLSSAQAGKQTLSLVVPGTVITSRQLYKGTAPASIPTEAALLINDCTDNVNPSATGASCKPAGTYLGGSPIQGFLQKDGSLLFSAVTLPANGQAFMLRITNVRVNANDLTAGAFVTANILSPFPIQNQTGLILGAVRASLGVSVTAVTTLKQCTSTTAPGTP